MDEPHDPGPYEGYVPPPPFAAPEQRHAPLPTYRPAPQLTAGLPAVPYGLVALDPPPRRRRRLAITSALVAVLALVGLATYWLIRDDTPYRPGIPAALDGYQRLTGPSAQQLESRMRALGSSLGGGRTGAVFDDAAIGLYAHNSGDMPVLIAFVLRTSDVPDSTGPGASDRIAQELVMGGGLTAQSYPSGPHGGVTRCGTPGLGLAAASLTICSWSDPTTSGLLVSARERLAPDRLAGIARDLRDAIK